MQSYSSLFTAHGFITRTSEDKLLHPRWVKYRLDKNKVDESESFRSDLF
jgi:hypothetical protein